MGTKTYQQAISQALLQEMERDERVIVMGEGIVGEMTGKRLKMLPSRGRIVGTVCKKYPDDKVLRPVFASRGRARMNPYAGYDSSPPRFCTAAKCLRVSSPWRAS